VREKLIASGGTFGGTYSYSMHATCSGQAQSIPSLTVFNKRFSGTVSPGGVGTIDFQDAELEGWPITMAVDGMKGTIKPDGGFSFEKVSGSMSLSR
jgi:RNA-splicing ligase RtcB